jgi:ABC-type sugar transport system ATPase subunit
MKFDSTLIRLQCYELCFHRGEIVQKVTLKNLVISFYGKPSLSIHDLSFCGRVGVLGASGSGKSVLLKAIAGTEYIDSGEIFFGEKEIADQKIKDREVALLSCQTPLFRGKSVFFNLFYPLFLRGLSKRRLKRFFLNESENTDEFAKNNFEWILEKIASECDTGCSPKTINEKKRICKEFLKKKVRQLGKREIALLYFLRVFLRHPLVMLLDQPQDFIEEIDYFDSLLKEEKTTFLYADYDYARLEKLCDYFLVLKKGEVVFFGTKQEIEKAEQPYVKLLVNPLLGKQ